MTGDALEPTAIRIGSDQLTLACRPEHGFVITELRDGLTGADALWRRPGFVPARCDRRLGPGGADSIETFLDLFVGAWFEMFPTAGLPGTVAGPLGPATSLHHGEVVRLPWEVQSVGPDHVEARVETIRSPFEVVRMLRVDGDRLIATTRIHNTGREAAAYVWGFHPCFDRETFAGGTIELNTRRAWVPDPPYDPPNNRLETGRDISWPHATLRGGGEVDMATIPRHADGRHEHICVELDDGMVRISAPRFGRALVLSFDRSCFPYALLWQNYRAPQASTWGTCDTFAVEPVSAPGRTMDDAIDADRVGRLQAGGAIETEVIVRWIDETGPR